jgi:hypothetical protein
MRRGRGGTGRHAGGRRRRARARPGGGGAHSGGPRASSSAFRMVASLPAAPRDTATAVAMPADPKIESWHAASTR